MNKFLRTRVASLKLFERIIMPKNNGKVYYAVGRGREIGIYGTWDECRSQTEGMSNAKYRKFYSLEEAEEFVNFWKNYCSPVKVENESNNTVESSEHVTPDEQSNCEKSEAVDVQPSSAQDVSTCQQHPQVHLQPPSPHSTCFNGRTELRNVDVMALNLRLDSFEKRFDACLKEVGAIVSEISHIKSEIKEIKGNVSLSQSPTRSGSAYSTSKGKDGMLQTTLNFGSNAENRTQSKSYSTYQDSKESALKRGKTLKRKLSRSDSSESSKRFAEDDDHDNLLSKINTEGITRESFTYDEHGYVEVYTDGASHGNGKDTAKAGIGIWWGDSHPLNIGEPVAGRPTNNTAEIQAARVAMEVAVKCGLKKLKILTDSEFLINCATRWIQRWKKNGWYLVNGGPVKNRTELEKLDKIASRISIRWEKVAGHAGIKGNEMADRLANEGAYKYNR